MKTIETYEDYIDILNARTSKDPKVCEEALESLEFFKRNNAQLYESFRNQKMEERRNRQYGFIDNKKKSKEYEQYLWKVQYALRDIDERLRVDQPITEQQLNRITELYGQEALRMQLKKNDSLFYVLLRLRKASIGKRNTITTQRGIKYNSFRYQFVTWNPLYVIAAEPTTEGTLEEILTDIKDGTFVDAKEELIIPDSAKPVITYAWELVNYFDEKIKANEKPDFNKIVELRHFNKDAANMDVVQKHDYYCSMLMRSLLRSFCKKGNNKKMKLRSEYNTQYYDTLRQHSATIWKELVMRMIAYCSILWRTDKGINDEGALVYLLSEEELNAILENMTDAELLSNIDTTGKVDPEKLLQIIIQKKRHLNITETKLKRTISNTKHKTPENMNAKGRKNIKDLIAQLEDIKDHLETMQEEEQDKFDNLPEGLQESERGEAMQEVADSLEEAVSSLEDVISTLNDIS